MIARHARFDPATSALVCPVEVELGRVNWTRADYVEQGRREWDAWSSVAPRPKDREAFARAFADVAMPWPKQQAEREALR